MTMKATSDGMMTIGESAKTVGVATSVLRYYEDQGLLVPSARSDSGYRMYAPEDVKRLQFIRSAQSIGFTLDDIRALLDVERQQTTCGQAEVQNLIERRLSEVEQKMKDLKRVRAGLNNALDRCRGNKDQCEVLKHLKGENRC